MSQGEPTGGTPPTGYGPVPAYGPPAYGAPGYPPPGYPGYAPPPGYGMRPPTNQLAIVALVLTFLGLLAPIGLGQRELHTLSRDPVPWVRLRAG